MSAKGPWKIAQYGVPDGSGNQPIGYPMGATLTLYSGEVALISGSGSTTTGYLKDPSSPGSSDIVAGLINNPTGGTYYAGQNSGAGFTSTSTDGSVWLDVIGGSFFFQSGTGSDALTEAIVGTTIYYGGENANGPYMCATSNGGARPKAGTLLPQDPSIANGVTPGSNYWPVKLNVVGGP